MSIPAFADFTLDFQGGANNGGAISGNDSTLTTPTGKSISITELIVSGAPNGSSLDQTYAVNGGALTINASGGTQTGAGNTSFNYTAGTFVITGSIPSIGINSSVTLLNGVIDDLTVSLTGALKLVVASGSDTKNADLVRFFCTTCIPTEFQFEGGTVHLNNITGPTGSNSAFTASTFSTDIPNDYVPEPASIMLLGTVFVGITHLIRRHATKG